MTLDDIKNHFGSGYQFERITKMSHVNYVHWNRYGFIPIVSQMRLEKLTGGTLKASFEHAEGSQHAKPE